MAPKIKSFAPQIDYLVFKGEIAPPDEKNLGEDFHDHLNYGKERILKYLSIPKIDIDIISNGANLIKFSYPHKKLNFQVKKERKNKLTIAVEAQGSYFIRDGKTIQDQVNEIKALCLDMGEKFKTQMILKEIHVAKDLIGSMNVVVGDINKILFAFKHSRPPSFMNGNKPNSGTHYIANEGAVKHSFEWEVCIYDKSKEVMNGTTEKNQIYQKRFDGRDITRVEVRLFTRMAKKWTRHFYESINQESLCQAILSSFGGAKRAYRKTARTIKAYENHNLSKTNAKVPFWVEVFKPRKSGISLSEVFYIEKSGKGKKSISRKLEKLFLQAESEHEFNQAMAELERNKDKLRVKKNERASLLAEQEAKFARFANEKKGVVSSNTTPSE